MTLGGQYGLGCTGSNCDFIELDPHQQYYLHCKASVRSLEVLNFLRQPKT